MSGCTWYVLGSNYVKVIWIAELGRIYSNSRISIFKARLWDVKDFTPYCMTHTIFTSSVKFWILWISIQQSCHPFCTLQLTIYIVLFPRELSKDELTSYSVFDAIYHSIYYKMVDWLLWKCSLYRKPLHSFNNKFTCIYFHHSDHNFFALGYQ